MSNNKTKYNWNEVQSAYDSGLSYRGLSNKFGMTHATITRAMNRGDFKSRSRSESAKLEQKRNPRTHTEATKKKISKSRIAFLKENPDMVPYLLNHYSKGPSYPEEYFSKIFTGLTRYHRIGLYELDFADLNKKIDLEIDGDQHYLDTRIVESDKRRTAYLEELGWTVIRIKWSAYQKLSRKEKEEYVSQVANSLKKK